MTSRKSIPKGPQMGGLRPSGVHSNSSPINQLSSRPQQFPTQQPRLFLPQNQRVFQPFQANVQRFKLFSNRADGSERFIPTVINVGGSSSSSSSCSEDEGMEIDKSSKVHSEISSSRLLDSSNGVSDSSEHQSSSKKRELEPILILSDDSDSDTQAEEEENLNKKAKLNSESSIKPKSPEAIALINMFPSQSDDKLKEFIQYGITMIDAEDLLSKLTNLPSIKTPTKVLQKDLYTQVKHGNLAKAIAYVKAGANPVGPVKNEDGRTPLHVAAAKGHLEVLLILLYKAGLSKFDCADNNGKTPLFFAVEKKQLDIAQLLIRGGANVRVKTNEGTSLLHMAARKGSLSLVKWLINLGVPVNDQDKFGWTALMWSIESDTNYYIIEHLIKSGADVGLRDQENNICLHWAASSGAFNSCKLLISAGKDSPVNAKNHFGETPLHLASKCNKNDIVQLLLLNGGDPSILNNEKSSALDLCPLQSDSYYSISLKKEVGVPKSVFYLDDISHGKERIPISCINEIDNEPYPDDFIYITSPEESEAVIVKKGLSTVRPCKCVGICHASCKCIKLCEKQKLWYTEDGFLDLAVFDEESPVLYECTPLCSCWSYCPNRVVQKGIQFPLQVFRTRSTGWGLRTLTSIPTGAFILPYVGELITDEEAEKRNMDTYLFNLDLKTCGDEPNCMDAVEYGNCGRFINHSCKANMKAVKLFTTHRDISYPGVAFFASKNIEPKEELFFNYGNSYWEFKMKNSSMYCKCMSDNCQYSGL